MATRSDKPADFFAPKAPTRSHDFSLDPLPVPDAVESDSDTVWGMWEETLNAQDDKLAAENDHPEFSDTIPADFSELPPEIKKP